MVHSPFRSAVSHSRRPEPAADEPVVIFGGPRGSRYRYTAAKMAEVRHLVETTLMTYAEIAQRTGVARGTVWHWSSHGKWMRPTFAPRFTHTVPAWRAGRQRRRRMLAVRLVTLAERYVRALAAASAVDAARLREARALLSMAKLATGPNTPRSRLLAAVRPVAEPKPRARVIADLRARGIDIARAPSEALADFIESCAGAADPARDPALRERGRYSKRNKEHARMLRKE